MSKEAATTQRRGRPKSPEKAAAIREAAGHLFMCEGLERTSMDAIAASAGVSKQTVYSHFHSKDDLFRACVCGKIEDYGLDASRLDADAPLDDVLRYIGRQYLTLLADPDVMAMFRLMISSATAFPQIVRSFYETGPIATLDALTARLARYLPDHDRELAARAATEYLALVRSCYFLELLLGIRTDVPEDEVAAQVEHCIVQIRKLYPLS